MAKDQAKLRSVGPSMNNESVQVQAEAIADAALRTQRGAEAQRSLIDRCMEALVQGGLDAQQHRSRRELTVFETDFQRVALLVDALLEGNYRDTAARLAGIAESGIRAWLQAADQGDERYRVIATLIHAAEAIAEAESVRLVRGAAKDPKFWAAAATWLERKFPDKYGRRGPLADGPGVLVQIGVKDSDVQVHIAGTASTTDALAIPVL